MQRQPRASYDLDRYPVGEHLDRRGFLKLASLTLGAASGLSCLACGGDVAVPDERYLVRDAGISAADVFTHEFLVRLPPGPVDHEVCPQGDDAKRGVPESSSCFAYHALVSVKEFALSEQLKQRANEMLSALDAELLLRGVTAATSSGELDGLQPTLLQALANAYYGLIGASPSAFTWIQINLAGVVEPADVDAGSR